MRKKKKKVTLDCLPGYCDYPYHHDILEELDDPVPQLENVNFDTFVGIGLSGILIIRRFSTLFNKNLAIIDKQKPHKVHGNLGRKVVFLDDFIETGKTYNLAKRVIKHHNSRLVGVYEYALGSFNKSTQIDEELKMLEEFD